MWSFIRTFLLLLLGSYIMTAQAIFKAQMTRPDGTVVQLDPDRDFTTFTPRDNLYRQHHAPHLGQLDSNLEDHEYSYNWCGAVANTNGSGWVLEVHGCFNMPALAIDENKTLPQYAAAWIGLDGYNCRSGFLQVGVHMMVDCSFKQTNQFFYSWWPGNIYSPNDLEAEVGDEIYLSLGPYSEDATPANWSTGTNVVVETLNKNVNLIFLDPGPNNATLEEMCATEAEWIVEDPRTSLTDTSSQQGDFADFAPIRLFLASEIIQNSTLTQDIYLTNMTTKLYLRSNDGKVKCRSEYSDDPKDLGKAMFVGG